LALILEVTSLVSLLFMFFHLLFMVSFSFLSLVIFEHCNCWEFKEHFPHWLPCSSHNIYFMVSQSRLETIKIICEDGMWHMDYCPLNFQCNVLHCKKIKVPSAHRKLIHKKWQMGLQLHVILIFGFNFKLTLWNTINTSSILMT